MLSQRLGSDTQKDPRFIDEFVAAVRRHPGCCDEVWLATDYGFPPLSVHEASAENLAVAAEKLREIGMRVSLQLSNSVGHGQYMATRDCSGLVYDGSPVEHMVGPDGTVAEYCFCWHGEHFRKYTFAEIRMYAEKVKPWCVWVDDDMRPNNHNPVSYGCFCDDCMRRFNARYGSHFTREELVQEISFGDPVWRERHIAFIRDGLHDFCLALGQAIHEVSPESRMGYQGCANGGYSGFGYAFIYDAMREATGKTPLSRPGGGAYNDHNPQEFIWKGEILSYQNFMLPDYVTDRRPEIESLPDVVYGKSIGGTCLETTYYLALGNTAMSYAMLMNDYEPMAWHEKMLTAFAEHRLYWEKLSKLNMETEPDGWNLALSKKAYLQKTDRPLGYTAEYYNDAHQMRYIGIPMMMHPHPKKGDVYWLTESNAKVLAEDEIDVLLHCPVVASGGAIAALQDRGIELPLHVEPVDTSRLGMRYTDTQINAGFAHRSWFGQFLDASGYRLLPQEGAIFFPLGEYIATIPAGNTESIPAYRANAGVAKYRRTGDISDGIVRTKYGARWAVFGFDCGRRTISTEKRTQYLRAAQFISGKVPSAMLLTPIQAIVLPRVTKDGRLAACSVTNCTVADSSALTIQLHAPVGRHATYMGQYIPETEVELQKIGDDLYEAILPNVRPWSVGTLFLQE